LILLAEIAHDKEQRYEIIDGMQRLNALVSFVEGEFDLDGKYFDLETMAQTKALADRRVLEQKQPRLERDVCISIVGYTLPLTVYPTANHHQIDEIFRRINAYGHHLSRQELRVAGVTSLFSQLVRSLASKIRGDVSATEKLYLNAMKEISITNRDLPYGIDVDTVFWVEQGVLPREDIRQSRDEELVADMLAYAVLDPKVSSSSDTLDDLFGFNPSGTKTQRSEDVNNAVAKIGPDILATQFMASHEALREIISKSGKRFSQLILREAAQRVPRYYQSVFLAVLELMTSDGLVLRDAEKAAAALDGAGANIDVGGGGGRWSASDREKNIGAIKGILRPSFAKRKANDPVLGSWTTEFENLLMQSHTEQALYDFKQGFRRLDPAFTFDDAVYDKVFETLAAMANHGPGAAGYVIVGVADSAATAKRLEDLHHVAPRKHRTFLVTGVAHEAADLAKGDLAKGLDAYFQKFLQRLSVSALPQWAKDQIARDARMIAYFDKSVLVAKVEAGQEPCRYGEKFFERQGPNNVELKAAQYSALFGRFVGR
jgi:hypothetical protein